MNAWFREWKLDGMDVAVKDWTKEAIQNIVTNMKKNMQANNEALTTLVPVEWRKWVVKEPVVQKIIDVLLASGLATQLIVGIAKGTNLTDEAELDDGCCSHALKAACQK